MILAEEATSVFIAYPRHTLTCACGSRDCHQGDSGGSGKNTMMQSNTLHTQQS